MKLPEIRIDFSSLTYSTISVELQKLYGGNIAPEEMCEKWAAAYRDEWKKYESKILSGLFNIIDLEFYKQVIDVSLAPYIAPAMSDPIIINFQNSPDEFVDVLTHELIHVLLTDNKLVSIRGNARDGMLGDEWINLFGNHDFITLAHIPVHAVHKKIYLEVLKDKTRLKRNIDRNKEYKMDEYIAAWDYVEKVGADKIIADLNRSYKELGMQLGENK